MKIVVVSGGFDPIHSGHIAYFQEAKKLGDYLVVALNSEEWLVKKKGKPFMSFDERKIIIENMSMVDKVIDFEDDDYGSASLALQKVKRLYPNDKIIFCNGGDRNDENIPEKLVPGIDFVFGVGGADKKNSSSWLLRDFFNNTEDRVWGKFHTLFKDHRVKLKELVIDPGKGLSYQKHHFRNEIWFVSKGNCLVKHSMVKENDPSETHLSSEDVFHVPINMWHQLINPHKKPCHIIEIQYGEKTSEDDIERISFFNNE